MATAGTARGGDTPGGPTVVDAADTNDPKFVTHFCETDFASHAHILTEAFRKFDVDQLGCQILIACEAGRYGNEKRHSKFGKLTSAVHKILR
jgi:hypothetical protein